MSEDEHEDKKSKGKSSPSRLSLVDGTGPNSNDGLERAATGRQDLVKKPDTSIKFQWTPEKMEYYGLLIKKYMSQNKIFAQGMYDLIMQPEIEENIANAARTGKALSKKQARPHPYDEGRDAIRNWVERYPNYLSPKLQACAERFILTNLPSLHRSGFREMLFESRLKYHSTALRDIIGVQGITSEVSNYLDIDVSYSFVFFSVTKPNLDFRHRILRLRMLESGVGVFHILATWNRPIAHEPDRNQKYTVSTNFEKEDIKLLCRGYFWLAEVTNQDGKTPLLYFETLFTQDFSDGGFRAAQSNKLVSLMPSGLKFRLLPEDVPSIHPAENPKSIYKLGRGAFQWHAQNYLPDGSDLFPVLLKTDQATAIAEVEKGYHFG